MRLCGCDSTVAFVAFLVACWLLVSRLLDVAEEETARLVREGTERRSLRPRSVESRPAVIILGWATDNLARTEQFKRELVVELPQRLQSSHAEAGKKITGLEVYVEEANDNKDFSHSAFNMFPLAPPVSAHVSIEFADQSKTLDQLLKEGEAIAKTIRHLQSSAVYVVTRSVYTEYGEYDGLVTQGWDPKRKRDWPKGTESPFIIAHTLIPKSAVYQNISNTEWAENYWWKYQSPMSEMIQPRARYVRNVVLKASDKAPAFAGIVTESWPSKKHMDDPFLFFAANSVRELLVNLAVMARCVMRFTDITVLQGTILSEYLF